MTRMNSQSSSPVWLLGSVALAVSLALGAGIVLTTRNVSAQPAEGAKTVPLRPALTVTTTRPTPSRLPLSITANGNIMAWQEASVGALANGLQLRDVRVNVGDRVKRGQVLATFGAETVQAELAQADASVAEAEAARAAAEADWARVKVLKDSGALSLQQIAQYETQTKTAAARKVAAEANARVARVRLAHTQVVAADDGIISARSATVGAVVPAGSELFRMIRQGRLEWRAEVTSTQIGRIKPGMTTVLDAANGSQVRGRVRMIAPTVDPASRLAIVYVDLPTDAAVSAGMFAKGEFLVGESDALTVPQQSVVVRDGFSFVFTIDAAGKVTQNKVTIGRRVGEQVELTAGLKADQSIVVAGAGFLADGDLVKVVASATTPAPSTSSPARKS